MRADFRLEDWTIRPLRDCIERGDDVVHIHPKPMAVLEALAAAAGEVVTRDELFERIWPGVIVTDDALTQCIVELRKAFDDTAQESRFIKTVPKVGFCLVPPVTFLDDTDKAGEKKLHLPEGRGFRSLIIRTTLIVVAVGLMILAGSYLRDGTDETETTSPVSIAVLPFVDLSETGDQQWFTDGLSEELIHMLSRVEGLRITNRTSSFHFRNLDEDLRVVADTLGVSHVLEGSVRRNGGQLRVTVQLIDASSGYHLWSDAYDYKLGSVLELQQDISKAVVHALMESLGRQLGVVTGVAEMVENEAHDAVLLGRHLAARRTLDDMQAAIREYEKAIAIEPNYALAHAELAIAFRILRFVGGDLTLPEAKIRARHHAELALALDPNLAEAYAAVAWFQETSDAQLKHYQQAIRINPSYAIAYTWMARVLGYKGRYRESFEMFETAIRLDPLSIPTIGNYIWRLVERGRLDDARGEAEKLTFLSPELYVRQQAWIESQGLKHSVFTLGLLKAMSSNLDRRVNNDFLAEQLAMMGLEQEVRVIRKPSRVMTLHMLGKVEDAFNVLQERFANNPDSMFTRRSLGRALAATGDYDQARPLLEAAWLENDKQVNRMGLFRENDAVALVVACQATGGEAVATEVLAAMQDYVRRLKEAGITATTVQISVDYQEGITAYLSGDRETGLSLLGWAVDKGFFILPNEAYLQTLYDDPGFAPIMARQRARQTHERDKFLAVVCNNNPYKEVWQPTVETCERFFTEIQN